MPVEIENWKMIKQTLSQHEMPTLEQARQLIGNQEEFLEAAEHKPIKFSSDNYLIDRSVFEDTGKLSKQQIWENHRNGVVMETFGTNFNSSMASLDNDKGPLIRIN